MKRSLGRTEAFKAGYPPDEGMDMRGKLQPRDRESWGAELPRYHQVFEERTGFLPGLSILDLLFCEGQLAVKYIQ
jgi:hypothetical protein